MKNRHANQNTPNHNPGSQTSTVITANKFYDHIDSMDIHFRNMNKKKQTQSYALKNQKEIEENCSPSQNYKGVKQSQKGIEREFSQCYLQCKVPKSEELKEATVMQLNIPCFPGKVGFFSA